MACLVTGCTLIAIAVCLWHRPARASELHGIEEGVALFAILAELHALIVVVSIVVAVRPGSFRS